METKKIIVSGIVQGVGFRWSTQMIANDLSIFGNVKNNPDGTVTIIAQGNTNNMDTFIKKVKSSPSPAGRVENIKISDLKNEQKLHSFQVIG